MYNRKIVEAMGDFIAEITKFKLLYKNEYRYITDGGISKMTPITFRDNRIESYDTIRSIRECKALLDKLGIGEYYLFMSDLIRYLSTKSINVPYVITKFDTIRSKICAMKPFFATISDYANAFTHSSKMGHPDFYYDDASLETDFEVFADYMYNLDNELMEYRVHYPVPLTVSYDFNATFEIADSIRDTLHIFRDDFISSIRTIKDVSRSMFIESLDDSSDDKNNTKESEETFLVQPIIDSFYKKNFLIEQMNRINDCFPRLISHFEESSKRSVSPGYIYKAIRDTTKILECVTAFDNLGPAILSKYEKLLSVAKSN